MGEHFNEHKRNTMFFYVALSEVSRNLLEGGEQERKFKEKAHQKRVSMAHRPFDVATK